MPKALKAKAQKLNSILPTNLLPITCNKYSNSFKLFASQIV
jgi:hypothetical protein